MSLINQVLNELESRGADVSLGEDAIRAVPPRKRAHRMRYAILAILMLGLAAAAGWYLGRAERPAPERRAAAAAPVPDVVQSSVAAVSAPQATAVSGVPAAAEPSASQPAADLHGKPLLAVAGEEELAVPPELKKGERARKRRNNKQQEAQGAESGQAAATAVLPLKQVTPQQRVENEFGKANQAAQEGRLNDALAGYEGVLRLDPKHHAARRALVGVLVSLKRNGEAEGVLQDGLKLDPHEASFAMLLARLQVERDAALALETLQATLPYAEGRADYQAFVAALLQRQNRHDEAVVHFQAALKLAPNNGVWLMGMGISLQALRRNEDARAAYQRALASNSLNAQLQTFVQQKLKEL